MYWLWALYYGNLDLLRQDLKRWQVIPAIGHEEQASIINTILPVMVDALTDADLQRVLDKVCETQPE